MGNSSKASSSLDTTRRRGRKKKGRPSLLDLQKRSLRLQKQQEQQQESLKRKRRNPNPSPSSSNPYVRFPNSASAARRSTRRNPNPSTSDQDEEEEEEEEEEDDENISRKEKKLRHVLDAAANSPDRTEREANCDAKATDGDAEPSQPGPTTPLPDKKLLKFVLDRLQKKDSYGVFSEPVDPEELPDYFDIIENPMDFGTVRKKLDKGEYATLEQFENDVFLICSNAMVYNASDTVYYRQARTIQELAKKDFMNLRTESENSEQEPKPAPRRGRPPMKKPGRSPAAERVASDHTPDVGPSNVGTSGRAPAFLGHDLQHKQPDKAAIVDPMKNLFGLRIFENNWSSEHRSERNDDFSGFGFKGGWSKWGKKLTDIDDSRRNTYDHPIPSDSTQEPPIFSVFDRERKVLVPLGIQQPHSYSRSLARFAAKLGPTAWKIVEKRIERVLPPGTKFGRGWIGENEAPQESQPSQITASPASSSPQPNTPTASCSTPPPQVPSNSQPNPSAPTTTVSGTVAPATAVGVSQKMQPNSQFQLNGFRTSVLGNMSSQVKNDVGNIGAVLGGMNHGHGYRGVSNCSQLEMEGLKFGGSNGTLPLVSSGGANRIGVAPPDLNVGFQSPGPGSPRSTGVVVDKQQQQQPDLALQL
ncbi:DNA-binding bromodomain-containing protein [Rhynchospora pubera]|uniref:DNA-binding bromodomain-containing protein n=1 Tax=Rhynchospora pubera TaxID=906938 RepID=A0AAV8EBA6_9POAL|nr:DNA-binding bromodomain-containing protein [Rhynchospora pubera]